MSGTTIGAAQASADSAKSVTNDSLARQGTDTTLAARKDTSAQPASTTGAVTRVTVPVDTIVASACREAPAGRPAPGLLMVVFRAGTAESARVAAAKEVRGTLAGMAPSGEEYIRLSPESGPLAVAAANLIQLPPVTSVSEKSCP